METTAISPSFSHVYMEQNDDGDLFEGDSLHKAKRTKINIRYLCTNAKQMTILNVH